MPIMTAKIQFEALMVGDMDDGGQSIVAVDSVSDSGSGLESRSE